MKSFLRFRASRPGHKNVVDFKKPTEKQLNKILRNIRPIPQIALKIIRMIRDERESLQSMENEIGQDQVISARALKLCNSAYLRMKMDIQSIDRAKRF